MPERRPTVIHVDPERVDRDRLAPAVDALHGGDLVAFPTETVYGLGADALNPQAVGRIFEAKERPSGHPLIVHAAGEGEARAMAADWPSAASRLASAFWPGPLTLIVEKSDRIPDVVTGGLATVGLRVPDHPVALALLELAERPIAAPSANIHTRVSPTRAEHVRRGLGGRVAVIVDGGATDLGIESTVVRVDDDGPTILRPGMIPRSEIAEVAGGATGSPEDSADAGAPRASPGMADKHYAPVGRTRLIDRTEMREQIASAASDEAIGVLTVGEPPEAVEAGPVARVEVLSDDPGAYGEQLYAALHRLEEAGCDEIWIEVPPADERWEAIRDRLGRATG